VNYQYTPLHHPESIRLLTLLYGEFSSPIRVRLAEVRLSKKPQYEALSYSWATEGGDTSLSSQIVCDEGKTLAVTKNCELALRYIRKGDSLTTLWVDAICINQQDIKERGHQVGIMRNVYANATKVLVWLGEESEEVGVQIQWTARPHKQSKAVASGSGAADGQMTNAGIRGRDHTNWNTNSVPSKPAHGKGERRKNYPEAIVSVSKIFLDFLVRTMAEVRQAKAACHDPESLPCYQELASQIHEGIARR